MCALAFFAGLQVSPQDPGGKDPDDLNAKARNWLDSVANVRLHGTHKKRSIHLLPQEGLRSLAGRRYPLPVRERGKVHKDCLVYFQASRYSVPFQYAGREVEVAAARNQLRILCAGELIAIHEIIPLKGQMVMREEHFADLPRPSERFSMKMGKARVSFHLHRHGGLFGGAGGYQVWRRQVPPDPYPGTS